jgi:hypothetical protein
MLSVSLLNVNMQVAHQDRQAELQCLLLPSSFACCRDIVLQCRDTELHFPQVTSAAQTTRP